jgi:hypothetical protein
MGIMRQIYFDESGNTGATLLDSNQPVFILASNNFEDEEAAELIALVKSDQASEAKFRSLKKSAKGRAKVLEFFKHSLISPQRAKTTAFHKQYMTMTKVVDILVESLAHKTGFDLYANGANIAMSNMHFYCMPEFCGADRVQVFLDAFITMVKEQSSGSIEAFYLAVEALMKNCIDEDYVESLSPILVSKIIIEEILHGIDYLSLDPAIPALFNHCAAWGEALNEDFVVVHDTSKPIKAQIDIFNRLMNKEIQTVEIGYDRRKIKIPLKSREIQFGDSKHFDQLQASDLIASATAYVTNAIALGQEDEFSAMLKDCGIEELMINAVWPAPEVSPEELGTTESGGINAADYLAKLVLS